MITLCAIGYIIFSLIAAVFHKHSEDIYGNSYGHTWKESLSFGFLILPGIATLLAVVLGIGWCAVQLLTLLLHGAEWIYHNMP